MANLAGKTFEVQTFGDGYWTTIEVHFSRTAALSQAEALVNAGRGEAVRVISDSARSGTEVIFEQELAQDAEKPIGVNAVREAPHCQEPVDYYRPEARRTLARVLRQYLDQQGISALELLFDRGALRDLERNETLYGQAIQQIATAQARALSVKPSERVDALYAAAVQIGERASSYETRDDGINALRERGVDALIGVASSEAGAERYIFMRHAFAGYLAGGGDWNGKIELMVALAGAEMSAEALQCLDEVLAELLEGSAAIQELLAGQADALRANRTLIQLTDGRHTPPPNARSCIAEFNNLMARYDLPETRSVLFQRVAGYLAGTRNLTREGRQAERDACGQLVRDLVDISGLKGGVEICESLTQRVRIALADDDDLSFEEAVTKLIGMLPNRAARIGYLLDLFQSNSGRQNVKTVVFALRHTIDQMKSLASLVPQGASDQVVNEAIDGLRRKMASEGLPAEWRETLSQTFDSLMAAPAAPRQAVKSQPVDEEEFREMIRKIPERKEIHKGQILFEEGDRGAEAYLILSGTVEIYRKKGFGDEVIATVGRGDIIGEMSLIDNLPRMASARVLENGEVSIVDQRNLGMRLDKLSQSDKVLRRLIDVLVNRIRGDASTFA